MTHDKRRRSDEEIGPDMTKVMLRARKAFRAKGWNTTPTQIAKACGIDDSLLLEYFPTLRELARAAYADELATLKKVAATSLKEMRRAKHPIKRDQIITDFVNTVCATFARRPVLAMTFQPFKDDPWLQIGAKEIRTEGLSLDELTRTFAALLRLKTSRAPNRSCDRRRTRPSQYRATIRPYRQRTSPSMHGVAKHHLGAILFGAANKRTAESLSEPVLDAVL